MMDKEAFAQAVEEGVEARVSYYDFVSRTSDYPADLLPQLPLLFVLTRYES